ncbi:MAG: nucleotide exchange factor GrpE [Bacteroidia bacterium]|nr:nucleotide exchange factor GrpE [Bacteroidia bacterium]MBT8269450.1 nucleotide exchange factor GrpE [Bacteroidia bacterium]NNK71437.1 nucleotide exchange factor GrpE [Flavobacteriaceae bacterium]NNL80021.1 nucleotide exchange factor GrpE [Flavobacteriaceae bacterium]
MTKKTKEKQEVEELENVQSEQNQTEEAETVAEKEEISEIDALKADVQAEKDKFLRLFAEFENYKKRTNKERIELFKTASQDVMVSLLPILDDFDRAYSEISKTDEKELLKGVELISNKLKDTLKSKGLEVIKVEVGDAFNADDHEAVTQIPAPSDDLKGKIIDVIEKGYALGEKVIRYPKVVIGQ